MRLTIWQFLGLVVIVAALYFVYHYWWVDQARASWVDRLHNRALNSEEELGTNKPENTYTPQSW